MCGSGRTWLTQLNFKKQMGKFFKLLIVNKVISTGKTNFGGFDTNFSHMLRKNYLKNVTTNICILSVKKSMEYLSQTSAAV